MRLSRFSEVHYITTSHFYMFSLVLLTKSPFLKVKSNGLLSQHKTWEVCLSNIRHKFLPEHIQSHIHFAEAWTYTVIFVFSFCDSIPFRRLLFSARRVCGTVLVQGIRFQSFFFNWKDSFDFIYLVVTYMSIFKTCAVCWLAPRARQITNGEWKY